MPRTKSSKALTQAKGDLSMNLSSTSLSVCSHDFCGKNILDSSIYQIIIGLRSQLEEELKGSVLLDNYLLQPLLSYDEYCELYSAIWTVR